MASYELASQFTEDVFAKEDLICERSACAAKILKGDPCFYIATIVIGQRGRFVCATCHQHYQGKAATSMRPTAQRPNPQRPNPQHPNPQGNAQVIRQNINAAWRPAVAQQPPPRVVATSAGPDIAVPSSWAQPGYSVNHAQYGAERECWAKQAYAVPPAETISLEITAVREGGNRRKGARGIPFGNICEGRKDVDARIDAPGLITLSLDTILPKIQAFATGFPWRQDQFVIRDGGWVDLSTHPPCQPYFYSQCTQATRKGLRAMTFKLKQFLLYVVVPTAQWEDYETWLEKAEEERFSMGSQSEPLFLPSATRSVHSSVQSSALASKHHLKLALSKAPVKRPFQREIASVPSSPPLKKMASANSGGTTDIDVRQMLTVQHENIEFFPIPTRPLSVILDDPKLHAAFRTDTELSHSGRLTVQTSTDDMLGIGGFKTAHPGFLTLLSAPEIPLGSRPRQKVAVKRPFYKKYPPGSSTNPINFSNGRYTISDELPKLFREANVLYWARSLLTFAYEYIDHCVANSSDTPPFHIPRLRFVEAGLALSHDHTQPGHKSKSLTMPRAGYLVEELITDDFIKYIHNMDCNPMLDPYEVGYEIAEFLACTQHIQFAKTGGLAFISDYQGGLEILSDPQVLTHPLVNKGKDDIFGDGNIERAVSTFEKEHNCNKFCKWSGFKLKIYEKLEIDEAETETD
ncbi:hypothetical protein EV424DRAFT_1543509 [Suillus variegatus]|nr:hypothetical protein EV424DRAFT_1543509 [Suillus variegatus]